MSMKPKPKGRPASMGTTKVRPGREVQPSQKREAANMGPPRKARGRRRASSLAVQGLPAAVAEARTWSQDQKTGRERQAPAPMGR